MNRARSDQDDRQDERDPPAVGREILGRHGQSRHADDQQGEQEAEGRRRLDPARVLTALRVRAVLSDIDRGAAVLAAEGKALGESKGDKDDRREDADLGVRRQEADQGGRDTHHRDRHEEGELPPDDVADPPEECRTERPNRESGTERGERQEQGGDVVARREELGREEHGEHAVDVEVVPLDDRPCGGRADHEWELVAILRSRGGSRSRRGQGGLLQGVRTPARRTGRVKPVFKARVRRGGRPAPPSPRSGGGLGQTSSSGRMVAPP